MACTLQGGYGYIKSVDEPITNYIPEFDESGFEKIKIKNLLQMTSGIEFKEVYGPFTDAANLYYGRSIVRELSKLKIIHEPGVEFHYSSGDSQIMGLVLSRALKGVNISEYLSKRIWQPLNMEFDASWIIDDNGLERAFCCINATAIDLAKIGRLYLNGGSWNGNQIVSKKWIERTIIFNENEKLNTEKYFYNYNWYINPNGTFYTQGYKGQHIYIDKTNKLIVVRLGKDFGNMDWPIFFQELTNRYKINTGYNNGYK
jgi:CubicO group peptidase (beta-lactamase class C family)